MGLAVKHLRPYTSLLLGRRPKDLSPTTAVRRVLVTTVGLLEIDGEADARRRLVERHVTNVRTNLGAGFIHYLERRRPPWLSPDRNEPFDELNQLILTLCLDRYVAMYLSEPGARAVVDRAFMPSTKRPGKPPCLPGFVPFQPGHLNAAFVEDEQLRTLWLRGIHRPTPAKADSKMLTGSDLENALSPLADQTYYFTAARSLTHLSPNDTLAVGVKPGMSRVWAGPVADWPRFIERLTALLNHLKQFDDEAKAVAAPVSILAAPVGRAEKIRGAYDISIIAPEILGDQPITNEKLLQRAERWAYSSEFKNFRRAKDSPDFSVEIVVEGQSLGRFNFVVDVSEDGSAAIEVTPEQPLKEDVEPLRSEAIDVCRNRHWLTVRYDSGHSISEGVLYSVRHRDIRFTGWDDAPMRKTKITKEKPTVEYVDKKGKTRHKFAPSEIGNQDSLFCWVQRYWPPGDKLQRGWLACDDGAGEIADFIHVDTELKEGPLVTLIHVKGSKSDKENRGISTSDYEVVVGQAVKNLRLLDRINLADQLEEGKDKEVADCVWLDGVPTTRAKMIRMLRKLGDNYRRKVIVLQPRVTKTELGRVQLDIDRHKKTARLARLRQLETLLVAAQAECAALQAEFVVLCQRL